VKRWDIGGDNVEGTERYCCSGFIVRSEIGAA
jgi:hypothetical protein